MNEWVNEYFNARPSPSNDSIRRAWQTRPSSRLPRPHRDHSGHDSNKIEDKQINQLDRMHK